MATLEQLVVSLVAETSGLRAELDKATKATVTATTKMDDAIKSFSDNSSKSIGTFETAFATAIGFLGSQAAVGTFNAVKDAASFLFQEFVVNGVAAAAASQQAMTNLNTQLALTGRYSKETSKDFQTLASNIESTTGVSGDAVLSNVALLASLTKLDNEGLKTATKAAVDLSAALQIDLDGATRLVAKAANGNVEAFTKYGITIDKGVDKTTTFANALKKFADFQGTAEKNALSFTGQQNILNADWEDLTKVVGRAVIENLALLEVMKEINKTINATTGELSTNEDGFKELIAQGMILFLDVSAATVVALDEISKAFQFVYGITTLVRVPIIAITTAVIAMTEGLDEAGAYLKSTFENAADNIMVFSKDGQTNLGAISEKLTDLGGAARFGLQQMKAGYEAIPEPVDAATKKVVALTDAQKAQNEILKQFVVDLASQTTAIDSDYQYQLELLSANKDAQLITEQEFNDAKLIMLGTQQESELALIEAAKAKGLLVGTQYTDAKIALDRKYAIENKKLNAEISADDIAKQKERSDNFKSTLGVISTLANSSNKELAAIGKAAAITQATIDGYLAVQRALASAPPPINFALAAAVGVATAANVAKIAGVGLNEGGTLVGGGANKDTIPTSLTKGETVIDRGLTEKLDRFLSGGANQQQGNITVEITLKDQLVEFVETRILERQRLGTSLLQGAV